MPEYAVHALLNCSVRNILVYNVSTHIYICVYIINAVPMHSYIRRSIFCTVGGTSVLISVVQYFVRSGVFARLLKFKSAYSFYVLIRVLYNLSMVSSASVMFSCGLFGACHRSTLEHSLATL